MTKVLKEIKLDKHVKLIDSPGVVFASALGESAGAAALRNCVKVERIEDPIAPCTKSRVDVRESNSCSCTRLVGSPTSMTLRQVARVQGKLKRVAFPT